MTTQEVILKYYEYVNSGQWDQWLTLFDKNVVGDEQLAGHFEGVSVLKGAVTAIRTNYSKFLMHPQHIVVEGGTASVVWQVEAANAAPDKEPIHYPGRPDRHVIGANYFEVNNGKITYMRTIHDSKPFQPFTDQLPPHNP